MTQELMTTLVQMHMKGDLYEGARKVQIALDALELEARIHTAETILTRSAEVLRAIEIAIRERRNKAVPVLVRAYFGEWQKTTSLEVSVMLATDAKDASERASAGAVGGIELLREFDLNARAEVEREIALEKAKRPRSTGNPGLDAAAAHDDGPMF